MTQKKVRIPYFDFLRGIAILMVVSIHTFELFAIEDNIWGEIKIFLGQIIQCAVPIFIAISGFFLAQKQVSYIPFLKRQIPKIYIPLLIWSLPYYINALNSGYNLLVATVIYLFCGFSIYYFIALIIQFYILSPILYKFNNRGGVFFACLITIIAVSFVAHKLNIEGDHIPLILYAGPFPVWLAFFSIGMWLGDKKSRNYNISPWIWTIIISLLLSYITTKISVPFQNRVVGMKLSTHVYSFAAIMLLFSERAQKFLSSNNPVFRFFTRIGSISFGIYLTHMYIIAFLVREHFIWGWFIDTAIVLLSTAFLILLFEKVLPPKITKYLGFR